MTLAVALLLVLWLYPAELELAFNRTFVNDRMATVLKAVILAVTAALPRQGVCRLLSRP